MAGGVCKKGCRRQSVLNRLMAGWDDWKSFSQSAARFPSPPAETPTRPPRPRQFDTSSITEHPEQRPLFDDIFCKFLLMYLLDLSVVALQINIFC